MIGEGGVCDWTQMALYTYSMLNLIPLQRLSYALEIGLAGFNSRLKLINCSITLTYVAVVSQILNNGRRCGDEGVE